VISFDWNCPKYITPRYTAAEIEERIRPLKERIVELEAALRSSRDHMTEPALRLALVGHLGDEDLRRL
jgi:hypothetical protein